MLSIDLKQLTINNGITVQKKSLLKLPFLIFTMILLASCAAGRTINYHTGAVDYNTGIGKNTHIIVAFQDIRPYVLSGDKSPTFVGLMRSITGIPYVMSTESGNPIADDFGRLVTNSLKSEGINAEYKKFQFRKNIDDFVKENSKEGLKLLVFSIREWKTDIHFTRSIHYEVTLTVYDSKGNKLASAHQKGHNPMGDDEQVGRRNLAEANVDIIGRLLKAPMVQAAILSDEITPNADKTVNSDPPSKDSCSVHQILKMKDAGLSDVQIKAACY